MRTWSAVKVFASGVVFLMMVTSGSVVNGVLHYSPSAAIPNAQSLSVRTVGSNGKALSNVTVQGLMQLPPSVGVGFSTVFIGRSGINGIYEVKNLSVVRQLSSQWFQYKRFHHNDAFSPFVLVFLTYESDGVNYTSQTSIRLTPSEILQGNSFQATAQLHKDSSNHLIRDHKIHSSNLASSGLASPSVNLQPQSISNPLPTSWYDGSNMWVQQNATQVNGTSGSPLVIPLSQGQVSSYSEVEAGEFMQATSTDLTGAILNPYSNSNYEVTTGSSNGQNSGTYTIGVWDPNWQTSFSYAYILGNLTVANYQLYQYNSYYAYMCSRFGLYCNKVWTPTGQYQTLVAITQIATGSYNIQGSVKEGQSPPWYSNQNKYMQLNYTQNPPSQSYKNQYGYSVYEITSTDIASIMTNYAELAGIVVAVGGIILTLATDGIWAIVAGISSSALGLLTTVIQWGSSSSTSIYSAVQYSSTDGQTPQLYLGYTNAPLELTDKSGSTTSVDVPTVFAYVYSPPPPSSGGGGGGCVLNGTLVQLYNGTTIPVQDLKYGMNTLSYSVQTHSLIRTTVTSITKTNVSMIMAINGGQLMISGMSDQPVYVKLSNGTEEWLTIGELSYNMQLFDPLNSTWINITSLSLLFGNFTVYDVQTAQVFHNGHTIRSDYIANGILVDMKIG